MRKRLASFVFLAGLAVGAQALTPQAAGVFVAIDEDGHPTEKILRVSQTQEGWRFEDRQPDGSWLDVSCHGGCEHRESEVEDLTAFFGAPPPPDIKPECVQNAEYAFCHFMKVTPGSEREGFVLVVRAGQEWVPVSMVRLPEPPTPTPKFESAHWAS